VRVRGVGCDPKAALTTRFQAHLAHQTCNPVFAHHFACFTQFGVNTRIAVGLAALFVDGSNTPPQRLIRLLPLARFTPHPLIVATT